MPEADIEKRLVQQGEMLANRVQKRFKHLSRRFSKEAIDVFRLYDWDIPEIRAVVDWYAGHLVIGEYMRRQSVPGWLSRVGEAVAGALEVPKDRVHLKERRVGRQDGKRYERMAHTDHRMVVRERDLRFVVNLSDFVDTGLFSDHRNTRQMVRELSRGKDVLNLFCYTGTFSCCAAVGGARSTLSVDRSETALGWARENMDLNGIPRADHATHQAHASDFLGYARRRGRAFDIAVVDPPSYSTTRARSADFDVARDHPKLLEDLLGVMREGAVVFFSTNHQKFELRTAGLRISSVEEITDQTIPEDYARKREPIHRCWRILV